MKNEPTLFDSPIWKAFSDAARLRGQVPEELVIAWIQDLLASWEIPSTNAAASPPPTPASTAKGLIWTEEDRKKWAVIQKEAAAETARRIAEGRPGDFAEPLSEEDEAILDRLDAQRED